MVEQVKQEFGVDISRSQCECYDPTKYSGRNLSKKFVELFELTREKFDKGLIDIPIANKYYRLKQYQRQLEKTRNVKTALKILEQAAKDIGGQFTNRQEITGKDGGPVQTVNSEIPVPMEDYLKARREVLDEY
ncbi:PF10045 family protein [Acinetobacter baumannii OIFC338]|nr:PF10045 family protein [Acinetobacter baumannii OIFC338]